METQIPKSTSDDTQDTSIKEGSYVEDNSSTG